jgi:hypothetical protein
MIDMNIAVSAVNMVARSNGLAPRAKHPTTAPSMAPRMMAAGGGRTVAVMGTTCVFGAPSNS